MIPLDPLDAVEDQENEDAGYLSTAARAAATDQCLPLLATYFSDAPTWDLTTQTALAEADPHLDQLADVVRLRVLLAAGEKLVPIVQAVADQPTFRYQIESEDSVGALKGRLDVTRYVRERWRREAPRRYPVRVLRRRHRTPENVLTVAATLRLGSDLARTKIPSPIPPNAPERRVHQALTQRLRRLQDHRVFVDLLPEAGQIAHDHRLANLAGQVQGRLDAGHIRDTGRYQPLVDWVHEFDPDNSTPAAGNVDWAFYDHRFDTKLFEIWVLDLVHQAIAAIAGPSIEPIRPLWDRARPLISWNVGSAKLRLHFQTSLTAMQDDNATNWRYSQPTTNPLRGFPDVAVSLHRPNGTTQAILIDPKLRERRHSPTEEIYKLLGYFENAAATPRTGAIVFYSPGNIRRYDLEHRSRGHVVAIGLDPQQPSESLHELTTACRDLLSHLHITIEPLEEAGYAENDADADEIYAAAIQAAAIAELARLSVDLSPDELGPTAKTTEATLNGIWNELSADTQRMLITSEYFAGRAPTEADHSGPLLGLAAACERTLYDLYFDKLFSTHPNTFSDKSTFGSCIYWLRDSTRPTPRTAQGSTLKTVGKRVTEPLIAMLEDLNKNFRIPAAHRDLVDQRMWAAGRALVIGNGDLLVYLVEALTRDS